MNHLKPNIVSWPFRRVDIRQDQVCELRRIEAAAIDMADHAIVEEVIRTAQQAGVDSLFLMDKQFVLDALREKLERDYS